MPSSTTTTDADIPIRPKSIKRTLTPGEKKAKRRKAERAVVRLEATKRVVRKAARIPQVSIASPVMEMTPNAATSTTATLPPLSVAEMQVTRPKGKPKIISVTSFSSTKPALQIRALKRT
ncbi:uncharacterized protein LOC127287832 [Leptopilina boulardi]|uniref:uncharacterized protein LOC127287832 n=1 Tax=Leptopilina boulardi TaxID=63433 RepID=UPI0021F52F93|nr:uncharacterized protein LOC127287832 [Leptopilina boulardi]